MTAPDLIARLPESARVVVHPTKQLDADVRQALAQGWTLEQIAAEAGRDLGSAGNMGAVVASRVAHCARTPRARSVRGGKCPDCARRGSVWIEDEQSALPIRKCDNPVHPWNKPESVDAAIRAAGEANPNALDAAVKILRDLARENDVIDANLARPYMQTAQVPGPVIPAAFRKLVAAGEIRPDGEVVSTDPGTHSKRVCQYRVTRRTAGAR